MNTLSPSRVRALLGIAPPDPTSEQVQASRAVYTAADGERMRKLVAMGFSQVGAADHLKIPRGSAAYVMGLRGKKCP